MMHIQCGSYMNHLDTAKSFLEQLPRKYPGRAVVEFLGSENEKLRTTLQALGESVTRCKAQLEELWSQESSMIYELSSVFIHRGSSPSWGHYFFYTRHLPDRPDSWFKMNDSEVTAVTKEEVLADTTDSTANAYLVSRSFSAIRSMTNLLEVGVCQERFGSDPNSQQRYFEDAHFLTIGSCSLADDRFSRRCIE